MLALFDGPKSNLDFLAIYDTEIVAIVLLWRLL